MVSVIVFEGEPETQTVDTICDVNPDLLGIPIYRETKDALFRIIEKIKERNPGITIVTGGHTSTLYGAKVLKENPQIDVVVRGEGERTMVELCDRLKNGKGLDGCRGIFYRSNGFVFRNPEREPVEDLDILDHPLHDSIPAASDPRKASVFVTVSSSRGCMGACEFCVEHRVSKFPGRAQWRGRSAGSVVREILDVQKSFPGKRLVVNFIDGSIEDPDACNKKRLTEILDAIEESGLRLAFSFLTRAESWTDSDEPLVRRMKRLGLYSASIGLESGSRDALRVFGKRATLEDNARACALFGECGVSVHGFFIMFQPYTTIDELEQTADFLAREKMAYRPEVWSHAVYIFPDTKLFRRITEDGLLLGMDGSGYAYCYAFKDGRVGRIAKIMEEISSLDSFSNFQLCSDKVTEELSLFNAWKDKYPELKNVEPIVEDFVFETAGVFDEVGRVQHQLFKEILEAERKGKSVETRFSSIDAWKNLLFEEHHILEKRWLGFQLALGRKKISIV